MNTNFYISVTNFLKKRTFELLGLSLILLGLILSVSFVTYTPEDPTLIYGNEEFPIKNLLGFYGSSISDFLLQSFGLISFLLLITFFSWGLNLILNKDLNRFFLRIF